LIMAPHELQYLEEVFVVAIMDFDLLKTHRRPSEVPLMECTCAQCQAFTDIYAHAKKHLQQNRISAMVPCIWKTNEVSNEYEQFTKKINDFLQQGETAGQRNDGEGLECLEKLEVDDVQIKRQRVESYLQTYLCV